MVRFCGWLVSMGLGVALAWVVSAVAWRGVGLAGVGLG